MTKQKIEITADRVTSIIRDKHPTSLTQIAKHLGFKGSVSGSVSKRIRLLVPDVADLLAANKTVINGDVTNDRASKVVTSGKAKGKKAAKVAAKKPAVKAVAKPQVAQSEGERLCPFKREGTKYRAIWLALWKHRQTGVTRKVLVEEITSSDKKFADPKTADFAITVVASPNEAGGAHRSANKQADVYWVQKGDGGNLKLHLRAAKA